MPLSHTKSPSFVPATTFIPRSHFPVRTPRCPALLHFSANASADSSALDQDIFLPLEDIQILNSTRAPASRVKNPSLSVGQLRAQQKRVELSKAPKGEDEEETRRVQVVQEELTADDLFGIVDGKRAEGERNKKRAGNGVVAPQKKRGIEVKRKTVSKKGGGVSKRVERAAETAVNVPNIVERSETNLAKVNQRKDVQRQPEVGDERKDTGVVKAGDLVIHTRHGVGRFRGLERTISNVYQPSSAMSPGDQERPLQEFAVIEYRDGDVYVPFSHFEIIRKLSDEQCKVVTKLDTISGSTTYSGRDGAARGRRARYAAKTKTRDKIRKQLVNLHGLYAERTTIEREPFPVDVEAEKKFAASCDFELTGDQKVATEQMFWDMSGRRQPMDRLLCGDVGFGKTEVAIRAAFRVIQAGKQVAILAPTTILAQQHFETFKERFQKAWPNVRIRCMTRFMARKENLVSREEVGKGEVEVAIGTHMLLTDSCKFSNLGLLIVDEEHRFGVNQKEKIRSRYRGVDTLFLSATPIPRTLHLALSGLRDASVLRTPPVGRKPVITKVSPSGAGVIRQAINFEIVRGGQVFFVVPRVEGIEKSANWIRDLFPKLRVLVAHGRLKDLEQRIWSFAQRDFDVLVCTTIIENGINMPDVNTVIIQDAGRFGLAQLHQLRGRVGRCKIQAYAWMLYSHHPGAQTLRSIDRLKALEKYSSLGSGFAIAQRDMEMRGVGTVLGVEQHGNNAVDAEEYAKMLAEELEHARTGNPIPVSLPDAATSTEVFLPVASFIPVEYISDFNQKMTAYSNLSRAMSHKGLASVVEDLERKFGVLPASTRRHVSILELKLYAKPIGISRIFTERQHVILDWPIDEATLQRLIAFLPNEQSRSRCQHVVGDERVLIRGLGICSGDVQLATIRSFLVFFCKASAGLLEQRRLSDKDAKETGSKLADSLFEIDVEHV